MDTLTRVLSRNVYKLELLDLPLDRPADHKLKKRKLELIEVCNKMAFYNKIFSRLNRKRNSVSTSNTTTSLDRSFSRGFMGDKPASIISEATNQIAPRSDTIVVDDEIVKMRSRSATTDHVTMERTTAKPRSLSSK